MQKSRIGRVNERLLQVQNDDLTVDMVEWQKPDAIQTKAGSLSERILQRLLVSSKPMSRTELCADQLTGGSVGAVRKTLQRMVNRGVIKIAQTEQGSNGGSPENFYVPAGRKSLGGMQNDVSLDETPCTGTEDQCDTSHSKMEVSLSENGESDKGTKSGGTLSKIVKECLTEDPSDTSGSAPDAPNTVYPRGSDVSDDERQAAFDKWKI